MPDDILPHYPGSITNHTNLDAKKPYELARAIPPAKAKKNKREGVGLRKAPGAPKRFKSSYILFFMSKQSEIKLELGSRASVSDHLDKLRN